jgi:hypothetical protein
MPMHTRATFHRETSSAEDFFAAAVFRSFALLGWFLAITLSFVSEPLEESRHNGTFLQMYKNFNKVQKKKRMITLEKTRKRSRKPFSRRFKFRKCEQTNPQCGLRNATRRPSQLIKKAFSTHQEGLLSAI